MGMSAGGSKGVKSEINVTPLVDVVLVLLIIFMVVTPMLQRGKDVMLPKAKQTSSQEPKDPLVVSITPDKSMWLESDKYDEDNMKKVLAEKGAGTGRPILLKGDEALTFGDVRRVMNVVREAGAKNIQLGVQELKE
jgi:biopolymer transport protein TolR